MGIDKVILELYRLAESGKWDGVVTDEALSMAIDGLEHLQELKRADMKKKAMIKVNRKPPRVWC